MAFDSTIIYYTFCVNLILQTLLTSVKSKSMKIHDRAIQKFYYYQEMHLFN